MARITADNGTVCAPCVAHYHAHHTTPPLPAYDRKLYQWSRDNQIVSLLKSERYAPYFMPHYPHPCMGTCDCTGKH